MANGPTPAAALSRADRDLLQRMAAVIRSGEASLMAGAAREAVRRAPLTRARTDHTFAVGATAARIARSLRDTPKWVALVETIGVLHDIGYGYCDTGMHALDGANVLHQVGAPREVVTQVAHHSTAVWEVAARRMTVSLRGEFGPPDPLIHAIIWVADFATSPTGHPVTADERIADIRSRYPAESEVIVALDRSLAHFRNAQAMLTSRGAAVPA